MERKLKVSEFCRRFCKVDLISIQSICTMLGGNLTCTGIYRNKTICSASRNGRICYLKSHVSSLLNQNYWIPTKFTELIYLNHLTLKVNIYIKHNCVRN